MEPISAFFAQTLCVRYVKAWLKEPGEGSVMLLRFTVANHRSLRSEQTLSLVATEFNEGTARPTGVRAEGREVGIVPVAGIFGANASGKSNVLAARAAMQTAVRSSLAEWAQGAGVPREPFALDPQAADETTMFEVDLLLGDDPVRYTYGFELSDERVEAEWLHAYPHNRKQVWFDRDARGRESDFTFPGDGLKGGRERLAEFTRPNSLFLTVAASLNHPQLNTVHRWFISNLRTLRHDVSSQVPPPTIKRRSRSRDEWITRLLRVADLGVAGFRLDPKRDGEFQLLHYGMSGELVPLDFATQESQGTRAWFAFLVRLRDVLDQGSLLLIDELDASLHPMLSAEVIRIFQDPAANPRGAQLVFTTHDATLLGTSLVDRPLDRDQVWVTTKQRSGETELYPLIDARPRKEENLERGYLRGRYGGVPRVTAGELVREVMQGRAEAA
jgi:predicted ATPase